MEGYLGEVRLFAGTFAPKNWAFCDGLLIQIASNRALFSLLGNRFGGDGRTMFGLPDLRGRLVIGAGQGDGLSPYALGQTPGAAQARTRTIQASRTGGTIAIVPAAVPGSGNNVQPVLGLNYIICMHGMFPARPGGQNWGGCVGEIRAFGDDFAPASWALCDGSVLSVEDPDNAQLFEVIGFTYGGDGRTTFALPDLRGRAAVGVGQGVGLSGLDLGRPGGAERIPTQSLQASTGGGATVTVNSVDPASGNNLQPVLVLNFIICKQGFFPRYGD
jgi:microcystin-dependent protein